MHQARDVLEVQAGGRFVEDQQLAALAAVAARFAAAERRVRQMSSQLQTLRLAAGKRWHRLSEPHVVQPDIDQRLQPRTHARLVGEERQRFGGGHREHLGDICAPAVGSLDAHLQRLAAVARTVAIAAAQIDIGQELHLHVLKAIAAAGRAAAIAGVEAEGAGGVFAQLRLRLGGKARADLIESSDVAGRI